VLAEDIAQDAFVTAWTKLAGLRDVERLPAWLCGIARNVARARRRTLRREEPGEVEIAGDVTPYDALDGRQTETALAAALARVPETYREPLVLFYCEQQSAGEVARALGVSDAAVHQRLSRGRALLAGDAKLVEHAPSRARRDLAAAVLAAIALGVGSSRVEASPRGKPMFKLAALALATALAAGTTYVVAHGHSSTPTATQAAAGSTTTSPARGHAARPPLTLPAFHRTALLPGGGHVASEASADITCASVGAHMAELAFDGATDLPPDPEVARQLTAPAAKHFEDVCLASHWPQDYMACMLGSPDAFSSTFDCAPYLHGIEPIAPEAPGTFTIPERKTPIAPTTDTSCASVAKHVLDLTAPDPAALATLPADSRQMIEDGLAAAQKKLPAQMTQACLDTAWPEARRACLAASTTVSEMTKCE